MIRSAGDKKNYDYLPQKNQPEAKQNSLVNRNNILIQISELVPATYVLIMQLLCFELGKFTIDNQRNRAKLRNQSSVNIIES